MENDDRPVGRILSRREVLALFAAAGAGFLVGCAPGQSATAPTTTRSAGPQPTANLEAQTAAAAQANPTAAATAQRQVSTVVAANVTTVPSCIVRPALTEGPYFVEEKLNRSDIRSDPSNGSVKEGEPLDLQIRVSQVQGSVCTPLQGAQVDLWHCDALGVYSDATDPSFGSTKGSKFLRGYQISDSNGTVKFTTIYPGWYQGRAVHLHFKIRTPSSNQSYDFTSQLFFDDALSQQVYQQQPYAQKGSQGMMNNSNDGIYQQSGGQTLLNVIKNGQGYAAEFNIALQMS